MAGWRRNSARAGGARDVGQAMARNPVPADHPLATGYWRPAASRRLLAPGGAATKIRMLGNGEGQHAPPRRAQQSLGF